MERFISWVVIISLVAFYGGTVFEKSKLQKELLETGVILVNHSEFYEATKKYNIPHEAFSYSVRLNDYILDQHNVREVVG